MHVLSDNYFSLVAVPIRQSRCLLQGLTYLAIDLPSFEVVIVDYDNAIDGIGMIEMIYEVTFAQVDGDLACKSRVHVT